MLAERLKFHSAVIFTAALLLVAVDVDAQSQSSCRTLRSKIGVCVPILTCRTITQLLENAPSPLPPSIVGILRNSHCGTFNNIHHVCCERGSITSETSPVPVTASQPRSSPATQRPASGSGGPKIRPSGADSGPAVRTGMSVLQATNCGESDADRVGNGEDATLSEYPWMALLVYSDGGPRTMDCGGSLITDQYVLTAAHCIRVGKKKVVSVRLGEHNIKEDIDCAGKGKSRKCAPPIQEIDVDESIYHADYNPSRFSNDIGLIRLISKAVLHTSVQPICLPITESSREAQFSQMIIAGWGRIENGLRADVLQKAVVPVRTNDYCQQIHRLVRLTDMQMCAGGKNDIDTCKGDSGGPIFFTARYQKGVRYVQYGVVSAGSSKCGSNYPGIYTKVVSYLPWLAANIEY